MTSLRPKGGRAKRRGGRVFLAEGTDLGVTGKGRLSRVSERLGSGVETDMLKEEAGAATQSQITCVSVCPSAV